GRILLFRHCRRRRERRAGSIGTQLRSGLLALAVLLMVLVCGWPRLGRAQQGLSGERRVAVVVGNNAGAPSDPSLRYARRDAERLAQTLVELGGVSRRDLFLLLDRNATAVRRALADAEAIMTSAGRPTVLVFFYSGHADENALHLGGTSLAWTEVRAALSQSRAALRIALVDACHAGVMAKPKGLRLGPQLSGTPVSNQGTAILVSSQSAEIAQESLALGGSFFSHFLISALRGAADENADGLVSLAEAHTYTTRNTLQATSAWAPSVQHPVYQFEITGHGDVILTDLREGAARVSFAASIAGRVVITERDSPLVVAEVDKRENDHLWLALPAGRYLVHVRKPQAVYLAEVTLPWGGDTSLAPGDLVPRSYQEVAQKDGVVTLRRHRLEVVAALESPMLAGMGATPSLGLGYSAKLAPWELGIRIGVAQSSFGAVDTIVDNRISKAGFFLAYERPARRIDLLWWLVGEGQYWEQTIHKGRTRRALVPAVGLGVGLRVPLHSRIYGKLFIEGLACLPGTEDSSRSFSPVLNGGIAVGTVF
ncbi:MAG: caspase family protein, partial [Pseudomonadota bacterium]